MEPSAEAVSITEENSFNGWVLSDADKPWWKIKDGIITGGSLEKPVPLNTWLILEEEYENFELTFQIKFTGSEDKEQKNSGVQVRSHYDGKHMIGYQVDAGPSHPQRVINDGLGYWGDIFDEGRRRKLVTAINQTELKASIKQWDDWNSYKIVCDGRTIKTWINGILAQDFTEPDPKVPANGIIALQAHKGGKFLVQFKNMKIKELPATEGSTKWGDPDMSNGGVKKKKRK
ncbi:3-keto-disaccharide hydrolase [Rubritalea sp.]|uniref:3-keto-disaccharide hydrolase n=1 Tax=Rubritalea sp. TaxID=2109375 RepID=UPI003EF7A5F3